MTNWKTLIGHEMGLQGETFEDKDFGHLHTDKDLILVYNELRKIFDTGVR